MGTGELGVEEFGMGNWKLIQDGELGTGIAPGELGWEMESWGVENWGWKWKIQFPIPNFLLPVLHPQFPSKFSSQILCF